MLREAPAMTVRQNLGELLNEVQYRRDRIVITKAGKPAAAMIDMELFERVRRLDEEFAGMADELAKAFADVPEEQGTALMDEAAKKIAQMRVVLDINVLISGLMYPAGASGHIVGPGTGLGSSW